MQRTTDLPVEANISQESSWDTRRINGALRIVAIGIIIFAGKLESMRGEASFLLHALASSSQVSSQNPSLGLTPGPVPSASTPSSGSSPSSAAFSSSLSLSSLSSTPALSVSSTTSSSSSLLSVFEALPTAPLPSSLSSTPLPLLPPTTSSSQSPPSAFEGLQLTLFSKKGICKTTDGRDFAYVYKHGVSRADCKSACWGSALCTGFSYCEGCQNGECNLITANPSLDMQPLAASLHGFSMMSGGARCSAGSCEVAMVGTPQKYECWIKTGVCHQEKRRVAILISGTLNRFVWQDTFSHAGDLRAILGCKVGDIRCPVIADVYIVLNIGNTQVGTGPSASAPPYSEGGVNESMLVNYFRNSGANNVSVWLCPAKQLQKERDDIEQGVKQTLAVEYKTDIETIWRRAESVAGFGLRWGRHGHALYLMHKVYKAALAGEANMPYRYTEFFWFREDNMFLPHKVPRPTQTCFPWSVSAATIVDKYCGFGSYGDKLHFMNPKGARVFFGPTAQDHIQIMAKWIKYAMDGPPPPHSRVDPMQTERWFQYHLASSHVQVRPADFGRVDSRYINNPKIMCTPMLYSGCSHFPPSPHPRGRHNLHK
eukprot:TRINITY_DN17389_c0_g1_i1.p1 TRINITY_DN17389_c0_g1~~TRINITY_DN17389_c0_g1_i1.p1  ORF type:complete len:598 (+),score=52.23 TRINITY_DN17389_c0_g1_i1:73-1866(+)